MIKFNIQLTIELVDYDMTMQQINDSYLNEGFPKMHEVGEKGKV